MHMPRPFISKQVERYGDCAMVTIALITFTDTGHTRKVLEQYETLSKGATKSARKSAKVYEDRMCPHCGDLDPPVGGRCQGCGEDE
jgi:hypothetical protein